uniref:CD164 sialomucin-like 2 protein n=1 Tax=Denticeps clupeoides TaxID=299321 RepID=A0AAY4BVS5_9TELE
MRVTSQTTGKCCDCLSCLCVCMCGVVCVCVVTAVFSPLFKTFSLLPLLYPDTSAVQFLQLVSCDSCVSGDPAFNLTSCVWRSCENDTACVSAADDAQDCSIFNDTAMCPGVCGSPLLRPPQFSQASFDLSSFIGGIILVLVLQAGGFFAMRFLKTKDSTYETM